MKCFSQWDNVGLKWMKWGVCTGAEGAFPWCMIVLASGAQGGALLWCSAVARQVGQSPHRGHWRRRSKEEPPSQPTLPPCLHFPLQCCNPLCTLRHCTGQLCIGQHCRTLSRSSSLQYTWSCWFYHTFKTGALRPKLHSMTKNNPP